MATVTWHIWIDWNNDGIYESDEAARLVSVDRIERGRSALLDDPMVGLCDLTLDNHDRRYDTWYSGATYYGYTATGKRIKVQAVIGATTYTLFVGAISEMRNVGYKAAGASGGLRRVTITANDGWKTLQQRKCEIALLQNTTQRDAIAALLNAVGWVSSSSAWVLGTSKLGTGTILGGIVGDNIDLGSDNGDAIPYWWIYADEAPSANLLDLARAHLGRVDITGDGKITFRTISADSVAATDYTLADSVLQEMTIAYPLENVRNKISVKPNPRTLNALAAIWTCQEILQLAPGESRELWVEYSNTAGERTPAISVATPVATTDYTANSASDGSGTNLTSSIAVSFTAYSSNAKLVVTNNSPSALAYLTLLQVRGQIVDNLESQALINDDTASQETYGLQALDLDLRWQTSTSISDMLSLAALEWYATPRNVVEVRFESNANALAYDLGAKISDGTTLGAGGYYRIGKITHEAPEGMKGQQIYSTWTLFPILTGNYWILGTSTLDVTAKLGV